MSDKVTLERDGDVTIVTLNRPEVRNAIDRETAARLQEVFATFESDASARVAVLAGAGTSFCAGGLLGISRRTLSKPVIAAVQGYAVAGGLELALWCDLRVLEDDAHVGVFCRRWGVPLIDGGTVRLPRLIGMGHAMDMILTGRAVGAAEALAWGLATRVVGPGQARARAIELATEIARFPQGCMKADRLSAMRQWGDTLEDALKREGRDGQPILEAEALGGATRFASGMGRSGDFSKI
jgi:enoyl-CoA hydratase